MTPGKNTSEFITAIFGQIATGTAAFTAESDSVKIASMICFTALACVYVASRGYVKCKYGKDAAGATS